MAAICGICRALALVALSLAAAGTVGACGGGTGDATVARIGDVAITKSVLDRWETALAPGGTKSASSGREMEPARRRNALDALIAAHWLIGEADDLGARPTAHDVAQRFARMRSTSFLGGERDFLGALRTVGRSVGEVRFEIETEVATARLRQTLTRSERPITAAQIAAYYRRHKQQFVLPERRRLKMTYQSEAQADQLRRKVDRGQSFSSAAQPTTVEARVAKPSDREEPEARDLHERAPLERAIFAAKPDVVTGPVKFRVDYVMFEVTRIEPARQHTFAEVQSTIRKQLADRQRRRELATFIAAWRRKWTAKTSCAPGYVVQKCSEYRGPRTAEDPTSFR